jgi:N6-L-threonylcarbamoyladenine synthase
MLVLGIETSCDETAAALVADGKDILSSAIAAQLDLLKKYGGVVPEIAARRHTELIGYVIKEALDTAGKTLDDVDAVAVTSRPGLVGCLMVGAAAAKTICYVRNLPLIGVHHIEGHIFANRLSTPSCPSPRLPAGLRRAQHAALRPRAGPVRDSRRHPGRRRRRGLR